MLPALAAVLISVPLAVLGRSMLIGTAATLHSTWLSSLISQPPLAHLWPDLSGFTLLTGYQDSSLFALVPGLPLRGLSVDPPLWTLQIEIFGSFWVLLLVEARPKKRALHAALLLSSVFWIGINELALFTVGYICAILSQHESSSLNLVKRYTPVAGMILLAAGLWLACGPDCRLFTNFIAFLPKGLLTPFKGFSLQAEVGAIMIFVGLLLTPRVQALFDTRIPRYLGRLSFPIYLLNWPVMLSAGSTVFLAGVGLGHPFAAAAAFVVGVGLTLGLCAWFETYVDAYAVGIGRRLQRYMALRSTWKSLMKYNQPGQDNVFDP